MKRNSSILILLLGLSFLVSYGQNLKPNPANKFLFFLNNFQVDSLQTLLADNFQFIHAYTTDTNDKAYFINKYVPISKNFNGKFRIIKATDGRQITDFLVEDQSDYFKYLNIDYPKWKIQIITNGQEKISCMTIDTTEYYQTYLTQTKKKGKQFERWLKKKYPDETNEILYNTSGLLIQRLKEYSTK
jgi:hypothetical protein